MDAPAALDKLMARGALGALRAHARALRPLQAGLDAALPAVLRGGVVVTGWEDGVLSAAVTDAALATRVRLLAPALCETLRASGGELARIHALRCRLAPGGAGSAAEGPRGARSSTPPARSRAGASALARAAGEVRTPALADALARLAAHLRGPD